MSIRDHIIYWVFSVPGVILLLLFLPIKGGGYQFAGIFDVDFLCANVIDYQRIILESHHLHRPALLSQIVRPTLTR